MADKVASSQLSISAAVCAGLAAGATLCCPSARSPDLLIVPGLADTPDLETVADDGAAGFSDSLLAPPSAAVKLLLAPLSSAAVAAAMPSAAAAVLVLADAAVTVGSRS